MFLRCKWLNSIAALVESARLCSYPAVGSFGQMRRGAARQERLAALVLENRASQRGVAASTGGAVRASRGRHPLQRMAARRLAGWQPAAGSGELPECTASRGQRLARRTAADSPARGRLKQGVQGIEPTGATPPSSRLQVTRLNGCASHGCRGAACQLQSSVRGGAGSAGLAGATARNGAGWISIRVSSLFPWLWMRWIHNGGSDSAKAYPGAGGAAAQPACECGSTQQSISSGVDEMLMHQHSECWCGGRQVSHSWLPVQAWHSGQGSCSYMGRAWVVTSLARPGLAYRVPAPRRGWHGASVGCPIRVILVADRRCNIGAARDHLLPRHNQHSFPRPIWPGVGGPWRPIKSPINSKLPQPSSETNDRSEPSHLK